MITQDSLLRTAKDKLQTTHEDESSSAHVTVCLLKKIKFLHDVDDSLLLQLATTAQRRIFKRDTALFHAGEPGHILFMVVSGWVRIEKVSPTGQTLVIGKRGPGTQLGELALFDESPRMADAVTETECELLSLERSEFLRCLMKSPPASLAVMASLAEMVRNAGANLESFRSLDTLGRLADLLIWYSERQGVPTLNGGIKINMRLTHQAIADQVGVQRETISRTLAGMVSSGMIGREGSKIVILSPTRLKQLIVN
jgi:CRP/FNR family transcriptional regulator